MAATKVNGAQDFSHAWRALRHRNFRLFFGGQTISLVGTWMTRLATSWLVYRVSGSAFLLGLVGFAGLLPTFLLTPIAGVWIDRLDQRQLLVWTQVLAMLQSLALAALTLWNHINMQEILWLSVLQGLINAFDMPGRQSFMIHMIEDKQDLSNAIALNSSMVNMTRLIGPSLAGIVIARFGEGYCFLIDGLSYLAVIASLLAMRLNLVPAVRTEASMLEQLKESWVYVSTFVPVRTILLLFASVSLMGMPFTVLIPIFATTILHGGPSTLGLLMGAMGVGAVVSAAALAVRKTVLGLGRVIASSAILFGAGLVMFGFSKNLWFSLVLMLIAGFGMMQQMAACNTVIQTLAPVDRRGRIMGYFIMAYVGSAPLGSLLLGGLAELWGAPVTVIIAGTSCILAGIWFVTQLGSIRKDARPIYVSLGILPS